MTIKRLPVEGLNLRDTLHTEILLDRGFSHTVACTWEVATTPSELPVFEGSELRWSEAYDDGTHIGVYVDDEFVLTLWASNTTRVNVSAISPEVASGVRDYIKAMYPAREILVDDDNVTVDFWSEARNGVFGSTTRIIEIVHWDENITNYTPGVGEQLNDLMIAQPPDTKAGQLILWTGVPGTGKTFALRALADKTRKWAHVNYIVDPESFFASPRYMMAVLLGESQHPEIIWDDDGPRAGEEKWRIIVLEDTGELLAADASQRTGQGLARLLNITDGMVGQGLKNLVLITTNEELGRLHPAVTRPGRCLSHVKFEKFSAEQAHDWLIKHDIHDRERKGRTLAELFAEVRGDVRKPHGQVGFVSK